MKINFTKQFLRSYKKLPQNKKEAFNKSIKKFEIDIFDASLKTHKLKHPIGIWSFRINYSDRVLFRFVDKQEVELIIVGNHDIYE